MSFVRIIHSVPDSAQTMQDTLNIDANATSYSPAAVEALMTAIVDGNQVSYSKVSTGSVQATATMTSTGSASNNETCLICNVTFTAKTSGATGNQFNISGTVATQAANIAAAINASSNLTGIVTATSALGVVTITAVVPGIMGNGLQISEALTNVTATAFASGSDGKEVAVNYGAAS